MMKKKGLLLLAIFCISIFCCSCGNNQSKTNTPTQKNSIRQRRNYMMRKNIKKHMTVLRHWVNIVIH